MEQQPIKIKDILDKLKADHKSAETYHDEKMIEIEHYRSIYNAELYGNEQKGKSQIVSKDSRRQSEWLHATLVTPFMDEDIIKCKPVTWEDKVAAQQNELVLNTQLCRQFPRYNFLTDAIKLYDRDGTVIVQTGWDYKGTTTEVERPLIMVDPEGNEYIGGMETVTETVTEKNHPTAVVRRIEDVFIDPTAQGDVEKLQFVIVRYESDLSTLRSDGRNYKNLDKIKATNPDTDSDNDYVELENGDFKFEDNPRKKLLVYEYWGNYDIDGDGIAEPIVCTWIEDTVIRLEGNPYPDNKVPFLIAASNKKPFEFYGEANSALIDDSQKLKTAVLRGMVDNMAQSNNGQIITKKGALDAVNQKRMKNGQSFEVNTSVNDITHGKYNQLPGSAFDMLGVANNDIESITGVMGMNDKGLSGGIGGSAAGAKGVLDAQSTRRLNTVRNIAENLIKPLVRKWMAYNAVFLQPEEVMRITNDEFVEVARDDLQGKVDIEIEVSTAEDNQIKAEKLAFMLQTMAQGMDPDMQFELMADWAELAKMPSSTKRLRDKAEKTRQQMEQPDPVQEEMKKQELRKMQLMNDKLAAEIQAITAGGQEDMADKLEKVAKARLIDAQRDKLMADTKLVEEKTDREALAYLKEDEGINHLEKLELEDKKSQANLLQMRYQALVGSKNEQIGVMK